MGNQIIKSVGFSGKGNNISKIDISNLARGIYYLNIQINNNTYARQIIKL